MQRAFNLHTEGDCRYVVSLLESLSLDKLLLLYTVSAYLATTFSIIIQLKIKISRKRFLITFWLYLWISYNPNQTVLNSSKTYLILNRSSVTADNWGGKQDRRFIETIRVSHESILQPQKISNSLNCIMCSHLSQLFICKIV